MKTHSPRSSSGPLRARLGCAALALCALGFSSVAHADGAKNLDGNDSRGFGDTTMRVGGSYTMVSGSGLLNDPVTNAPTLGNYKRNQYTLDFDVYGFWDATRFDSLIGAELLMKFGLGGVEKYDGVDPGGGKLYFRSDAAFDYGVVHWDGNVRGRISFGAGAGMDFAPRWYGGSRYYPQILGRVQLWFGDLGVHASWHHLPATTGDYNEREHRFELGVGTGPIHGGVRYTRTRVRSGASVIPDDAKADQSELGLFLMGAF
jgi:hypothetical protein